MKEANAKEQLRKDNAFGFIDSTLRSEQVYHPLLVSNEGSNTMLKALRDELRRSERFIFSVAFVTPGAIALLKQALVEFQGRGTIITSTYLGFNTPAAFRELLNISGVDVFLHLETGSGFHAKGYIFEQIASTTAIIGSSNLTQTALLKNHEWNLRFSALPNGDIVQQLHRAVEIQLAASTPLTAAWIDLYEHTYVVPPQADPVAPDPLDGLGEWDIVRPNSMQVEALAEIEKIRASGEDRAIVISATGTGKTILAALDVRAVDPKRMLFIVHREQILDRAIEEFKRVLHAESMDFGKFVGQQQELDRRYVFATIQSISRLSNLSAISPGAFDYVLIDEVHRAGADSYRRVIEHLRPQFLLGMTATPERTDDFNVFELFNFNVPYEIRLQKALEEDMLAPFHYYGVTDFERDGEVIDDTTQLSRLVAHERVDHLIDSVTTYGHAGAAVRGLLFCSRKDEAHELSRLLNEREVHGRPLRTRALTGDDSIRTREIVTEQLEDGQLDYIVTVDVFNEGIDIPTVNQVVMLRQTQSSIVFTQQLGRGLRKAAGKEHLIVIDFIGNYSNNYLIPIALFGDSSLNKDSIRKKIIDAHEAGAISGLSSVNFDLVSRQRIFDSLAKTKLDSMQNLKRTFSELANRLGHPPALMDFARFDTADPVIVAGARGNYWRFLLALKRCEDVPSPREDTALKFLSAEILNGKRPHELLLLRALLDRPTIDESDYHELLVANGCNADDIAIRSVARILSLEFFTAAEREKYGSAPLVRRVAGSFHFDAEVQAALNSHGLFASHFRDVVETGLFLARHRYQWAGELEIGRRYSRKDACRLLNWDSNEQSTIYGYKVDFASNSCPIFITYHKGDEVAASTRYEDEFINESMLKWFTRSRRTLKSGEVSAIVENRLPLHLFAKKDDAEGTDFYYLGRATSSDAAQEQMPGEPGEMLDVVTMTLGMESPIEASLYEYLTHRPLGLEQNEAAAP